MSLIDELKGVLARRKNVLEIFGTYKSMYDELLQGLAHNYNSDIDTATSAFYLANYVMDNVQGDSGRLDDDERVQHVLKNLIKAKEHLTVDFETLINIYSLIFDWAVKIEKEMVKNARLLIDPKVIATNVVDIYAIPLFSFLRKLIPKLDLRWAMAELDASLRKIFRTNR
jgi:chorismate mutase